MAAVARVHLGLQWMHRQALLHDQGLESELVEQASAKQTLAARREDCTRRLPAAPPRGFLAAPSLTIRVETPTTCKGCCLHRCLPTRWLSLGQRG